MEQQTTYKKIRFIGYAIPTTPANLVSIGDPNGPGAVAGTYLGFHDPTVTDPVKIMENDIQARVDILKNAVDTANKKLPKEDGVINLFAAPEFYFHGTHGPYMFSGPKSDPVNIVKEKLAAAFKPGDYPHWSFFFGSTITSLMKNKENILNSDTAAVRNTIVKCLSQQWQNAYGPLKGVIFDMLVNFIKVCHSYPNCVVRNRNVILSNIPIRIPGSGGEKIWDGLPNIMTTEKYYVSNEDFVLYDPEDPQARETVTEQMTAYPPIDLSAGDTKNTPFDEYAIFSLQLDPDGTGKSTAMDIGVEICLDHSDTRLRRNIDNESASIKGIHVQVIPSCGMQIKGSSVAAQKTGFVFNCDGQYALSVCEKGKKDNKGQAVISDVDSLFANYAPNDTYAAHTQLARVKEEAKGGDPNSQYSKDAEFETLTDDTIDVIPVKNPETVDLNDYFAGGAGELHIYGLKKPFDLYP